MTPAPARPPESPVTDVPSPTSPGGHDPCLSPHDTLQQPEVPPSPEPDKTYTPPPETWWRRREAFLQTVASIAAVLLMTLVWWRVSGSKPAVEDTLLTDTRGRQADLAGLPVDLQDAVTRTLRDGRLSGAAPLPAELRPRGGGLAGSPTEFRAVGPVGVVVRDRRPVLRWTLRPGATGYVVRLDAASNNDDASAAMVISPELPATQTEWTPPEPLAAGVIYTWQVEARRGSETLDRAPRPPAAEARFQVLDEARAAALERLERGFNGFPLVMAVALARAGLADEAAGQLGKLAREHPQSDAALRLQRGAEAVRDRNRGGGSGER